MLTLSDYIEEYIKRLLSMTANQYVEIQRNELAEKFNCVPSQINYVLSTRFTPERGYVVQSRRGGKGYIRIMKIEPLQQNFWKEFQKGLASFDENESDEYKNKESEQEKLIREIKKMRGLVKRLYEERLVTRREAEIIASVLREDIFNQLGLRADKKKELVKDLMYHMLKALLIEA